MLYLCNMHIDYLIIGQGISGTWLSYYLRKAQKNIRVIDNQAVNAPSRLAAGIINPVTGRRHAEVWMADELLPFCVSAYTALGTTLGITAISPRDIIDFFPSPQMRSSFLQRVEEGSQYLSPDEPDPTLPDQFCYEFGYGKISPAYTAHLETILPAWRKILQSSGQLLEEEFDNTQLIPESHQVRYKDLVARQLIFCDGASHLSQPWFQRLPFAPNKGEALLVEIPDLPATRIYKKSMTLVPLAEKGQWWIGSSYEWDFKDPEPTAAFYARTEQLLQQWLRLPFQIKAHLSGIRPATIERRPFVGLHPLFPSIGILNGMGTKGCSLAPYFAKALTDHLLNEKPLMPEADVRRFTRILQRP